jgi:hypothetical protein
MRLEGTVEGRRGRVGAAGARPLTGRVASGSKGVTGLITRGCVGFWVSTATNGSSAGLVARMWRAMETAAQSSAQKAKIEMAKRIPIGKPLG